MAILNDEMKAEIVTKLAQFRGYSEIGRDLTVEYGVHVERGQIRNYDPTKPTYNAGDRWRALFDAARGRYMEEVGSVPIAHRAYRLNMIQRIFDRCMERGHLPLALTVLRDAAREAGGNCADQQGVHPTTISPIREMSREEQKEAFIELLRQAKAVKDPIGLKAA